MNRSALKYLMFITCMYCLAGCAVNVGDYRIDVRTQNQTKALLSEVAVWFGEARCSSGYLVPSGQKTHLYYPAPITKTARVEWKDEAGTRHEVELDLGRVYQSGQSGLLEIVITDAGVVAQMKALPTSR